jgi:hypothetical protein
MQTRLNAYPKAQLCHAPVGERIRHQNDSRAAGTPESSNGAIEPGYAKGWIVLIFGRAYAIFWKLLDFLNQASP